MTGPRLAEHDAAWRDRFALEAERIRRALGDVVVAVEHVGSTAVPGLAGKPTVDIAAGVDSLDLSEETVRRLEELGFHDAKHDDRPWERVFRRGESVPWETVVHVVVWGGTVWTDFLRFRDALRGDPHLVAAYADLKRRLLAERGTWYRGVDKQELITRVLAGAPARAFVATRSAAETEALAAALARRLGVGDVVTVSGDLGTGKTTFVRGACRALGVAGPVTSPTFTIGHRYRGDVDVSHLDLYRFSGVSPAEWADLEPYFEEAIVFVEWPEAGLEALPPARVAVRLEHGGGDVRRVELTAAESPLLEGFA